MSLKHFPTPSTSSSLCFIAFVLLCFSERWLGKELDSSPTQIKVQELCIQARMTDSRRVVCLLRHHHFSSQQRFGQEVIISHSLGTPGTTATYIYIHIYILFSLLFLFLMRALSYCRDMSYFYDRHCSFMRKINGSSQL